MPMKITKRIAGLVAVLVFGVGSMHAQAPAGTASATPGILTREQAAAILPATVFFHGQSAPIQARNSAGVRFADGRLVLAAIVDTSGYSSGVAGTYQAYLITEVPLKLGDQILKPGAYGFGFVEGGRMVIADIGGAEVLHTSTSRDVKLARPVPLQISADGASYHLYLGRNYISFTPAPGSASLP